MYQSLAYGDLAGRSLLRFTLMLSALMSCSCGSEVQRWEWATPRARVLLRCLADTGVSPVAGVRYELSIQDGDGVMLVRATRSGHDEIDPAEIVMRRAGVSGYFVIVGNVVALTGDDGATWCTWDARSQCPSGEVIESSWDGGALILVLECDARAHAARRRCRILGLGCEVTCVSALGEAP